MRILPVPDPAEAVRLAPVGAEHLIVTFSHALDLELCHRLLGHGFASCGLIGSATKWARFRSRLAALGHGAEEVGRITCPIGNPALGKHPQAIAVGVAGQLLAQASRSGQFGKSFYVRGLTIFVNRNERFLGGGAKIFRTKNLGGAG